MSGTEKNLADFGYEQELERTLSLKDLIIYGLIFMVPIAPFGIYGSVVSLSEGMVALAYLIGMVAMFFTALSYGQMAQAIPIAGSVYAYAQHGINKTVGFLAGWMIILDYIFIPALLYVISANSLSTVWPMVPKWVWLVAFISINTVINVWGIQFTAKTNIVFLIGELIVLAIFMVCGIWGVIHGVGNGFTLKPLYDGAHFDISVVLTAVSVAVLSFLGFDGISTLAEETKGGNKMIGKAILWALLIVGTLFVLQTYIAGLLIPGYTSFKDLDTAFYEIAFAAGGPALKLLTTIAIALALGFADALVAQTAVSRVLFGMSRDKTLPAVLSKVHPKFKTPYISTYLVGVVSLIVGVMFMNHLGILSSVVNCGALAAFLIIHVAVVNYYIIRHHSHHYWHHLVVPVIGFLIIAFVMWNLHPLAKIIGSIWLAIGAVYYVILRLTQHNANIKL